MAAADDEFYWDWYKHEESLATNRGSFFLVAQSMLFAAYAALRAATTDVALATVVFCVLGIVAGMTWLLVGLLHLLGTRRALIRELERHEPRRAAISAAPHRGWSVPIRAFHLMALFLPGVVSAAWLVLLFA